MSSGRTTPPTISSRTSKLMRISWRPSSDVQQPRYGQQFLDVVLPF
jgi:hypothetical protein